MVFKTSDSDEIVAEIMSKAMALAEATTPQGEAPAKRVHGSIGSIGSIRRVHGFSPAIGTQAQGSPDSSPAAATDGGIGAKLKAKDVKKGMEVQLQVHKQLSPQLGCQG